MAKMDIVGFEIGVDEIRIAPSSPSPLQSFYSWEAEHTRRHTDQVDEDNKIKAAPRESDLSSVVVFPIRPCYWCCEWK